jgi:hypothetical protein
MLLLEGKEESDQMRIYLCQSWRDLLRHSFPLAHDQALHVRQDDSSYREEEGKGGLV